MMSKEREFLARVVKADIADYIDIIKEAEQLLTQPEQEPLSEEQMFHRWLYLEEVSPYLNFTAGVRYAEEQHNIGVE